MWLRLPESWPTPVTTVVFLLLLTSLDLLGSTAAKEAVERRSPLIAGLGAALFVGMFWVFASSLQISGLVVMTVGWCVLVQVGVLLVDRLHYGVELTPGKYLAIVVAIAAQAYLVAGPSISGPEAEAPGLAPDRPVIADAQTPSAPRHRAVDTAEADATAMGAASSAEWVHTVWIYTGPENQVELDAQQALSAARV